MYVNLLVQLGRSWYDSCLWCVTLGCVCTRFIRFMICLLAGLLWLVELREGDKMETRSCQLSGCKSHEEPSVTAGHALLFSVGDIP